MKKSGILFIIILFVFNLQSISQIKKANKYYELFQYSRAIPVYQDYIESGKQEYRNLSIQRLADSYRLTSNVMEAAKWYKEAVSFSDTDPINYFYLGQSLRGMELYEEAAEAFSSFAALVPDSLNGEKYRSFCVDIQEWMDLPEMAEIKNVETINTSYYDFGPTFYKDGLVFTSDRRKDVLDKSTYGWTSFGFLDLYFAEPEYPKSLWSAMKAPRLLSRNFNQTFHDGPVCFSSDNKMVFVTRTTTKNGKKDAEKIRTHLLNIYYGNIEKNGNVNQYKPFPFNSKEYSVAHPTLSQNNEQIIFSSDMPGGFGGSDLYMSSLVNGEWTEPINLGESINTTENEVFPYWANDSVLYFSSEGHLGYGGLDIYQTKRIDSKWSAPENLMKPVNSSYDDFGIVLYENLTEGFFSSNRPEGKGADDIYAFRDLKYMSNDIAEQKLVVSGFVKDRITGQPLEMATVFLLDPATENVTILKTDKNGQYKSGAEYDRPYVAKAMKNGYIYDCTLFRTTSDETDNEFKVPHDLLLARLEVNQVFAVENIYYDLDKWFIREDAQPPLDNLVQIMKQYPIHAELSSHTDSRATAEYNLELSQKRAESAVRYIILQGVEPARITAKGYGETKLVNECADGVECTEEQHQANRRTEFKITAIDQQLIGGSSFNPDIFKNGDVIHAKMLQPGFFENCLVSSNTAVEKKAFNAVAENNNQNLQNQISKRVNTVDENYRVQILATSKYLDVDFYFSNIKSIVKEFGLSVENSSNLNKYQLGNFSSETEAIDLKKKLNENGYEDCFVVKM